MHKLINSPNIEFTTKIENTTYQILVVQYPLHSNNNDYDETTKALHHHHYYEMVYIQSGSAKFVSANDEYTLFQQDLILIPPNTSHKIEGIEHCKAYKIGVVFSNSSEKVDEFVYFLQNISVKHFAKSPIFAPIFQLIEMKSSTDKINFWQSIFTLLMYALLDNEIKHTQNHKKKQYNKINVEDAINNYLIYNYTSNISIEDLSNKIFICPRQINRICKKLYNTSFSKQKNIFRIDYAKTLLRETNYPIDQISLLAGYDALSTFYSAFYKICNQTPKNYRMQVKNLNSEIK